MTRSYTALASVDPMLWAPTMGEPSYTLDEVRAAAGDVLGRAGLGLEKGAAFPRWLQSYNDPGDDLLESRHPHGDADAVGGG